MHIADVDRGVLGVNGIVGAGMPIGLGAAFSSKFLGLDRVTVTFFGDGASNRGTFHESLNMAAVWNLPIVFLCENNQYGMSCPQSAHMKLCDVAERASAYGVPGLTVDGNDVVAVHEAAADAVGRARSGGGPARTSCSGRAGRRRQTSKPFRPRPTRRSKPWWRSRPPARGPRPRTCSLTSTAHER
jgi:pyruvate dehydrogenase E1 component alpha subunit